MKNILMYIWQLPQHLLGLIVILVVRAKYDKMANIWVSKTKRYIMWGVSLGNYRIFRGCEPNIYSIHHEEGHSKQSKLVGPLYLLVVGLPSFVRNIYGRLFKKGELSSYEYYNWYHSGYPEKWADKLGGVIR